MIRLETQPYCQDCFHFQAEVEEPELLYCDGDPNPYIVSGDTVVRCQYRYICSRIAKIISEGKE